MIRLLMRGSACFGLGLVMAVLLLIGLMFFGQFDVIHGLNLTGKPLAHLVLMLMPESLWGYLTGMPHAGDNPHVQSFLQLCAALGQVGLLLGAGFFRLWYAR